MRYICTSIVATLVLAGTSFAATINVPADQPTIAAAISASVNGDVIAIAAGTYNEHTLNTGGKAITIGSASGNLDVTIDAQQGGSVFVFNSGETSGTEIKDLVITGGSASYGGGISCDSSDPSITACTISGNKASIGGGGISCDSSNPTITDCTIEDNTTNYGGGIYCYSNSNPTITDCTIEGNTSLHGGGISCMENSSPTITNCTISDNESGSGGGILCWASNPTITGCTITGNTANANDEGGGIYCGGSSSPVHSGCHFSGNTPDNVYGDSDWNPLGRGGAPSIITIENCTIFGTGEHIAGNIPILHLGENHIHDGIDDGDLDGDGDVDVDDLNLHHAAVGICQSDVNHDGDTDIMDLLWVIDGWGGVCP